jgi:ATP-dependent Clp protease ATP-binding subunit ClpC
MMAKFTERAKKAMDLAQEEARRMGRPSVGSEHILLGILTEGTGVALNVLHNLGLNWAGVDAAARKTLPPAGEAKGPDPLPLGAEAKAALAAALVASERLGHNYVGTEHLLLGLIANPRSAAAQLLKGAGLSPDRVRQEVLNILGLPPEATP